MVRMKSEHDWVDEFFKEDSKQTASLDAERMLDYALLLLGNSTFRAQGNVELDLVDCYRDLDALEWNEIITCLKLNQLRCVDNYTWSQKELARWIRLIAFHEYR